MRELNPRKSDKIRLKPLAGTKSSAGLQGPFKSWLTLLPSPLSASSSLYFLNTPHMFMDAHNTLPQGSFWCPHFIQFLNQILFL